MRAAMMLFLWSAVAGTTQASARAVCVTEMEYAPRVFTVIQDRVTFRCKDATSLDLIYAVGRQTRHPIGILLGADAHALERVHRSYNIRSEEGWGVLQQSIQGTGYALRADDNTWIIEAPDLTERQRRVLQTRLPKFAASGVLNRIQAELQMALIATERPVLGFGGSVLSSLNDEKLTLPEMQNATLEETADRIAWLGSHALWVLHATPREDSECQDYVEFQGYQHYSDRGTDDRSQ